MSSDMYVKLWLICVTFTA